MIFIYIYLWLAGWVWTLYLWDDDTGGYTWSGGPIFLVLWPYFLIEYLASK